MTQMSMLNVLSPPLLVQAAVLGALTPLCVVGGAMTTVVVATVTVGSGKNNNNSENKITCTTQSSVIIKPDDSIVLILNSPVDAGASSMEGCRIAPLLLPRHVVKGD